MEVKYEDWLAHIGTPQQYDFDPHGSGRYRQGSGDAPYQHPREFRDRVAALRRENKGITEKEISDYMFGHKEDGTLNVSIRDFRKMVTAAKAKTASEDYLTAHKMRTEGHSFKAISERIGCSESAARLLLKRDSMSKERKITTAADVMRESLEAGKFIDIGAGSELTIGTGRSNFEAAVKLLEGEGYVVRSTSIQQLFGQGNTTIKAICPPGTTKADLYRNADNLTPPALIRMDKDGERIHLRPVENVDSSRIEICYPKDGGALKDGVIELRRGVSDLDMGSSTYAQVRISVDGKYYLKGMAVYTDDLPDGIDIRFNTSKPDGAPIEKVFKPIKHPEIPENPFGASIQRQSGALNIVNDEGDWSKWSRTLASQFLSKQYDSTAKRQLKMTEDVAEANFAELCSLTNPTIKRYLLEEFANSCDADAVKLKAVRLPGQSQKVLLPLPGNKPLECYCPTLPNGTEVALVRYPHGGIFEIPVLRVNNKNAEAEKIMGNAMDAIGIHPSQAQILSGADFDGDTVMVLPINDKWKLKQRRALEELEGFEPKVMFDGSNMDPKDRMKKTQVQNQMGMISNLITDMTIGGADWHELARAVAHSMVVIDAEKHGLDYKASERYFRIDELKKKYQTGGASTLISQAKGRYDYPQRREKAVSKLTPEELERWKKGEKIYEPTGKTSYKGAILTTRGTKMGEAKDAYELSSGSRMESYYADYANYMKDLANRARAEARATGKLEYSASAYRTYIDEVASLKDKLNKALMNSPLERKAQALADHTWNIEKSEHPEYTNDEKKKAKSRHLQAARDAVGAGKKHIEITDREWEAIQAGAVHDSTLLKILANTKSEDLKVRAMPRGQSIAPAKLANAKRMYSSGNYTWAEIADILGISVSTLQKELS